jgi:hypothetical protein
MGFFDGNSILSGATTLVGGASLSDKYFADSQFVLAIADLTQRSPTILTLWPNPSQDPIYWKPASPCKCSTAGAA